MLSVQVPGLGVVEETAKGRVPYARMEPGPCILGGHAEAVSQGVNCVSVVLSQALLAAAAIVQLRRTVADQRTVDEVRATAFMEFGRRCGESIRTDEQFSSRQG